MGNILEPDGHVKQGQGFERISAADNSEPFAVFLTWTGTKNASHARIKFDKLHQWFEFRCERRKTALLLPRGLYQSQFVVNGDLYLMEGRRPSTLLQRVLLHPAIAHIVSRTNLGSQDDPDLTELPESDLREALIILNSILPANRWEIAPSVLIQPGRYVKGLREVSRVRRARMDAEKIANNPRTQHDMRRAIMLSRMQLVRETLAPLGIHIDALLTDVFDKTIGLDVDPESMACASKFKFPPEISGDERLEEIHKQTLAVESLQCLSTLVFPSPDTLVPVLVEWVARASEVVIIFWQKGREHEIISGRLRLKKPMISPGETPRSDFFGGFELVLKLRPGKWRYVWEVDGDLYFGFGKKCPDNNRDNFKKMVVSLVRVPRDLNDRTSSETEASSQISLHNPTAKLAPSHPFNYTSLQSRSSEPQPRASEYVSFSGDLPPPPAQPPPIGAGVFNSAREKGLITDPTPVPLPSAPSVGIPQSKLVAPEMGPNGFISVGLSSAVPTLALQGMHTRDRNSIVNFVNGDAYEGPLDNGRPHGRGSYFFANGDRFEGEFKYGVKDGFGTYFYKSGSVYSGSFKGDSSDVGVLMYSCGDQYIGQFRGGVKHGKGKYSLADGTIYEGMFDNDTRHGVGRLLTPDGVLYDGEFRDDVKEGRGTLLWTNGQHYQGQFLNGQMHGIGTYTFEDGSYYEGQFHSGHRHGFGNFHFANRDKYQGSFSWGEMHGSGVMYRADGRIEKGDFHYGLLDMRSQC